MVLSYKTKFDLSTNLELRNYKNIINCFDCCLKLGIFYANDDVDLARALINHLYIDLCMSQC